MDRASGWRRVGRRRHGMGDQTAECGALGRRHRESYGSQQVALRTLLPWPVRGMPASVVTSPPTSRPGPALRRPCPATATTLIGCQARPGPVKQVGGLTPPARQTTQDHELLSGPGGVGRGGLSHRHPEKPRRRQGLRWETVHLLVHTDASATDVPCRSCWLIVVHHDVGTVRRVSSGEVDPLGGDVSGPEAVLDRVDGSECRQVPVPSAIHVARTTQRRRSADPTSQSTQDVGGTPRRTAAPRRLVLVVGPENAESLRTS